LPLQAERQGVQPAPWRVHQPRANGALCLPPEQQWLDEPTRTPSEAPPPADACGHSSARRPRGSGGHRPAVVEAERQAVRSSSPHSLGISASRHPDLLSREQLRDVALWFPAAAALGLSTSRLVQLEAQGQRPWHWHSSALRVGATAGRTKACASSRREPSCPFTSLTWQ
jgi:hypothetical protein